MKRQTTGLNCLLAIDKPSGMTSHDVVSRVRRALGERRVGHAGTLDPAATGVMIVGVGQATRLLGYLTLETKAYLAQIAFGSETTTDDAEGSISREAPVPASVKDEDFARQTLAALIGEHEQVPPAFSAISVKGKRAYQRARAGEEVELEARPIRIDAAQLIALDDTEDGGCVWTCAFAVSKGTYIRSIARDLGRSCSSAAHLCALRRSASGVVTLADCMTLEDLAAHPTLAHSLCLDPARCLGYPVHVLGEEEYKDVSYGRRIEARPTDGPEGSLVTLVYDGRVRGIWERSAGQLKCCANFPDGIVGVREHDER